MAQMAQFAPIYDVILEDAQVDTWTTFDSTIKYDLAGAGTAFEYVTYKVNIRSPSPLKNIQGLMKHAENGCHAAQSFRNPVTVSFEIRLNGQAMELDN
jgi:organic hydroperoxide reductase OsmC/OhrA